jgi:hypothetical protein
VLIVSRFCVTCDRRLDTNAAQRACDLAGHGIELRDQRFWWIRYQVRGRPVCVSSGSEKKEDAKRLLRAANTPSTTAPRSPRT